MAEYIRKQDVIDYLNGYLHSIGECGADSLLFDRGQRRALINSIQDILAVKAADVQPIKHGKWIGVDYDTYFECSECKPMTDWQLYKYCPYCGAKMIKDGEQNDT